MQWRTEKSQVHDGGEGWRAGPLPLWRRSAAPALEYALALAACAAATGLRWWLGRAVGEIPAFLTFYPAVVLSALFGGTAAGMFATALSVLAVDFFFFEPRGHLGFPSGADLLSLVLFGAINVGISIVAGQLRATRRAGVHARRILEQTSDAFFHIDSRANFTYVNSQAERLLSRPRDELLGRNIWECFPPAIDSAFQRGCLAALAERASHHFEVQCAQLGIWLDVNAYPTDGGLAVFFRDITARKNSEQAIRESEEKFRCLVENMGTAAGIVQGTRFVYVNQRMAELLGYTVEELLLMHFPEVVHPSQRKMMLERARRRQRGEAAPGHYEFIALTKCGNERWFDFWPAVITYHGRPAIIGTGIDITDRKRAESGLASAKAAAEQANRAKDQFLAVLSHELRTPLTPVLAAAQMLERESGLSADGREHVEMIRRNATLEARLIDDLLDVTRITRGKLVLDRRVVEVCTIVQSAVNVCRCDIEARGLHLDVSLKEAPYLVHADPARMQQVFWNLIKNAIKFTPEGGCIAVEGWRENGSVAIAVRDTGEGIEPEALGRIFNAFEQAERAVTRRFGGLGLGLTISKSLVEVHGGTISAESEGKGCGATFTVRLPLHVAKRTAGPRPTAAPSREHARPEGLRILLVEDHADTARTIARLLGRDRHDVRTTTTVAAALQEAERHDFDLLICDLGLPDGSGVDLMEELRSRGRVYPGIAMTGYGQDEDIARTRAAGFAAHLIKPVDMDQLSRVITNVTGAKGRSAR